MSAANIDSAMAAADSELQAVLSEKVADCLTRLGAVTIEPH